MISISKGNRKLGEVPSFSLPAGKVADGGSCLNASTCSGKFNPETGNGGCYAMAGTFNFRVVKEAYNRNMHIIKNDIKQAYDGIQAYIGTKKKIDRFRFDVSGDTLTTEYRDMQIELAANNPHVKFLKYTKVYGFYKGLKGKIPANMSVLFSWFIDTSRDQEKQIKRFMDYSQNKSGDSYPMAVTSLDAIETYKALRKLGRKPVLCPSQTMGKEIVNCDKCNLCFEANTRGIDIVFQHHFRKSDEEAFKAKYHGEFKQLRML